MKREIFFLLTVLGLPIVALIYIVAFYTEMFSVAFAIGRKDTRAFVRKEAAKHEPFE